MTDYREIVLRLCEGLETLDTLEKEEVEGHSDGNSCEFNPNVDEEDDNDTREV